MERKLKESFMKQKKKKNLLHSKKEKNYYHFVQLVNILSKKEKYKRHDRAVLDYYGIRDT